jgi:type VI secretion system Hcp family effector
MTVTSANHKGNATLTSRVTQISQGARNPNSQFKTVRILKEFDAASPKLLEAQATNELLNVKLKIDAPKTGKAVETLDLQDATIVSLCETKQGAKNLEEIQLTFGKIEVTNHDGSKSNPASWDISVVR